jgi:hypothetical protein
MYNKPQGLLLLLLLYQELTEYCCNHPVDHNNVKVDIINSVLDRSHLWGIRFKIPRAFYVHVHSYIISQLTIQLIKARLYRYS